MWVQYQDFNCTRSSIATMYPSTAAMNIWNPTAISPGDLYGQDTLYLRKIVARIIFTATFEYLNPEKQSICWKFLFI